MFWIFVILYIFIIKNRFFEEGKVLYLFLMEIVYMLCYMKLVFMINEIC